jgi:hypothetical protein
VASKTSLLKDVGDPNNKCDDPEGIPKGHICVLQPVNHPCLSGTVAFSCGGGSTDIVQSQKLQTHCKICGGVVSDAGDTDSREGFIQVELFWGPNSFNGDIDEVNSGIFGYAIYTVNECNERQGTALTTVPAIGIGFGVESCCDVTLYKANVLAPLYPGVKSQAFMVVPLTSVGALDVGWVTDPVVDAVPTTSTTTTPAPAAAPAPSVPSKSVADYRTGTLPDDKHNQSSVSLANVEEAGGKVDAEEDSSPQLETTDSADGGVLGDIPVWAVMVAIAGVPVLIMGAYVKNLVWKKRANFKEEEMHEYPIHDIMDIGGSKQPEPAPPPPLHPIASHWAAPPEPKSLPSLPCPPEAWSVSES